MALNKRERTLLIVTITVLFVTSQYLLAVPMVKSWRGLDRDLYTARRELEAHRAHIARVPQWQAEYDQLRGQVGKMTQFEGMSDLLKTIEEVGATAGVIITKRKPLMENDRGVYRELPVQCGMDATIESLVKFLFALRTGSGFVNVEQLQVQPQPNNPSILRCDILIHAVAGKAKATTE